MTSRKISASSLKQYNSTYRLFCSDLNINKPNETFINLCYKISQRTKKIISNETIKTALSAILYKLKENNANKDLINEYSLLVIHMRKICMYKTQNPLMNNNIPDWNYLLERHDYWKDADEINSDIYYIISGLYTIVPPRRIIDYAFMYICHKNINPVSLKNLNDEKNYFYYYNDKAYFIFNNYKTKKTYGSQIFKVPEELKDIIIDYINKRNLKNNDNLFMIQNNNAGKIQFYRLIQKTFDCSVDVIRHSYISYLFDDIENLPTTQELKQSSIFMAHSISMHLDYRKEINNNEDEKVNIGYDPELLYYINPYSIYGHKIMETDKQYQLLFNIIKCYCMIKLFEIYCK